MQPGFRQRVIIGFDFVGATTSQGKNMPSTAFLFPGQGAQHVGMGKSIAANHPAARALFDRAGEVLGFDLAELCFAGPAEKLDTTIISQPALFVCSLAALEMLREQDPSVMESVTHTAGLSLGEYTALVFAGAMTFEEGLKVVQRRGEAMQAAADANPSGMVSALMLERDKVAAVRDEVAGASDGQMWIANYLCPGNTVLSGSKPACAKAVEVIEQAGGRAIPLTVAGAFHTPLMNSACEALAEALQNVTISPPRIPVISNVDAQPHTDPQEIREILVRQVVNPVLWEDSVRTLIGAGVTRFYEVGPGRVLKGLMKRIDRKIDCQVANDTP